MHPGGGPARRQPLGGPVPRLQGPQLLSPQPPQSPETLGPQIPIYPQHRAPWVCGEGQHGSVAISALGKLFKKPALSFYYKETSM